MDLYNFQVKEGETTQCVEVPFADYTKCNS